jgi:hypothetical protein
MSAEQARRGRWEIQGHQRGQSLVESPEDAVVNVPRSLHVADTPRGRVRQQQRVRGGEVAPVRLREGHLAQRLGAGRGHRLVQRQQHGQHARHGALAKVGA